MLRYQENKLSESDDQKIQKMAYDFFQYIVKRDLPSGKSIPDFDEKIRQDHAELYLSGVSEFIEAIKNFTDGYMRSMMKDEQKYKADFGSIVYDRVVNGLRAYSKYA